MGFICLCCSERRLRVVVGWGGGLFIRMRRHLCASHGGNIATWLGRNLSETFEIPLVVGVFGCVELNHGIVTETPYCREPPLLQGVNN